MAWNDTDTVNDACLANGTVVSASLDVQKVFGLEPGKTYFLRIEPGWANDEIMRHLHQIARGLRQEKQIDLFIIAAPAGDIEFIPHPVGTPQVRTKVTNLLEYAEKIKFDRRSSQIIRH